MESQTQQPEYASTTPESIKASEPGALVLPPAQSSDQWQQVGEQVSVYLAQLPETIGEFFNKYKQPLIVLALIGGAVITVKVVLAILDALNDIPLLSPTFELVGIGYSVWFVNRYLLKESNRKQLGGEIDEIKKQVIGSQQLPE